MANKEHLAILRQGVDVWNQWKNGNPGVLPDFRHAVLSGVNLAGVTLNEANFRDADLSRAILREADLRNAVLVDANLSEANLRRANLMGADLRGAALEGADLTESEVGSTNFGANDLADVRGLHTVVHIEPSVIGIDTIYRSEGKIPEVFLRGAGVPDNTIEHIASLTEPNVQYYSCFISYSTKDNALARRLHSDLQSVGIRAWFAPADMRIGDRIRPAIDQSIRVHDKLLLVLSEHSVDSKWVEREVELALAQERDRAETVLFPIRLDDAVFDTDKAWATVLVTTRHIADFRNWEDGKVYQEAFRQLVRDLTLKLATEVGQGRGSDEN